MKYKAIALTAVLLAGLFIGGRLVLAQIEPPAGAKVEICHVTDAGTGEGHLISIADNSAALNAHKMLHGDCEDYTSEGEDSCMCEVSTTPMPPDDDDDDSDSDDDSDDDSDADDE